MGIGKFVKAWRWTSGMTQMQYLADVDASIGTGTGYSGVSDGYFATIPYFAKTFNGTEEIIACHEQLDPTAPVSGIKSYIEKWTTPAGSSTSSPQVYPYTGFTSANDEINFIFDTPNAPGGTLDASSHESRLATADNGSGTTIGAVGSAAPAVMMSSWPSWSGCANRRTSRSCRARRCSMPLVLGARTRPPGHAITFYLGRA